MVEGEQVPIDEANLKLELSVKATRPCKLTLGLVPGLGAGREPRRSMSSPWIAGSLKDAGLDATPGRRPPTLTESQFDERGQARPTPHGPRSTAHGELCGE